MNDLNKKLFRSYTTSRRDKLIQNADFNLDLLVKHNKHSSLIDKLKSDLKFKKSNPNSDIDINDINEIITKMYLSYSIKEGLNLLYNTKIDKFLIKTYEQEYIYRYYDNTKLEYLFKEIENDIKHEYSSRCTFNLLPFYYNIYLNQMK